jgi:hypothetical protein
MAPDLVGIQMKNTTVKAYIFILLPFLFPSLAWTMPQAGCGAGDCRDCHALSKKEAATLLKGKVTEVIAVKRSQVPGLWAVEEVDQNIALAKKLFISSTPTLSMPDGRVMPGYKVAANIVEAMKPANP